MLAFPLKYYAEDGLLLPPFWLNVCFIFGCRGWIVFAFSYIQRGSDYSVLNTLYPEQSVFVLSLILAIPAFILMTLIAYRHWLWGKLWLRWSYWLKPVAILLVVADFALLLLHAQHIHWRFDGIIAAPLLINGYLLLWLLTSKRLSAVMINWASQQRLEKTG